MVANWMTEHPDWFKSCANRTEFCRANDFLVCRERMSGRPAHIAYPNSQFLVSAFYKKEALSAMVEGTMPANRRSENLLPTAFVYESDSLSIADQRDNIRAEAYGSILSVTYSGAKSLHVLVPIDPRYREALAKPNDIFKDVWRGAARRIFHDTSALDEACATIGRLSRMPGAPRLKTGEDGHVIPDPEGCPEQSCLYYSRNVIHIRLDDEIRQAWFGRRMESTFRSVADYFARVRSSGRAKMRDDSVDDELLHLERSNAKYPTPTKTLILDVLDGSYLPSQDRLVGCSYYGALRYLADRYSRELAERYLERVKREHPSNLPNAIEEYLNALY